MERGEIGLVGSRVYDVMIFWSSRFIFSTVSHACSRGLTSVTFFWMTPNHLRIPGNFEDVVRVDLSIQSDLNSLSLSVGPL